MKRTLLSIAMVSQLMASCLAQTGSDFPVPSVPAGMAETPYPRIAATEAELQRLRTAWQGNDEWVQRVVMERISAADRALASPLAFPPRGGQHNQWYQCRDCQLALQRQNPDGHQCPQCQRVYHGEPYDDVLFGKQHRSNLKSGLDAAWAHAITGEAKYGDFAAQVLTGYAARYRDYPYHTSRPEEDPTGIKSGGHLFEQTLTEASAYATYVAPTYDLVRASGLLSAEQDQAVRDGLLRPMVDNIAKYRAGKSNWQTWHNAALIAGGAVLGDRELVERAIADPQHGFLRQMEISVTDDGMWYENSWAYHFYTLRAMILIAESARRLEIDLWSHPRLQSMFSIGPGYAMPGGRLPRFGDDVDSRVRTARDSLEFAYHAQPNPGLQPFLNPWPTWDSILLGRETSGIKPSEPLASKLFPAAGHAILHTRGPAGLATAMTFGPYGGFHGHLDKLSFVFFGWKRELGVDPGRARSQAYRLPIHKNWYKATLSHNTVVVDRQSQQPAGGELLLFEPADSHGAVIARCRDAYPGVTHTRLLIQTDHYLLVFDDLQADSARRFDWFYHNRGQAVRAEFSSSVFPVEDEFFRGMEYVRDAERGRPAGAPQAIFEMPEMQVRVTLDEAAGTELLTGLGVGSSVQDRVPLVRVTRQGRSVRFAAVLEPLQGKGQPRVEAVHWQEQPDSSIHIQVTGPGLEHRVELPADRKTVRLVK